MTAPLLEVKGLVKAFHGNRVVDDVSVTLDAGKIVALLGENGAGKSTLIKMLAGVYRKDGGQFLLEGRDLEEAGVRQRISFIHQDLGLVDWMTVGENMALSLGFPRRGGRLGLVDWPAVEHQAAQALALVGGGIDPATRVFDLPRTEKALVAIARALVTQPALLVLDEPTASLPADEVERLFAVMRRLKARNVGMVYVSHRLDEIFRVADRVVVLRDGEKVSETAIADTTPDQLIRDIVGQTTFDAFEKSAGQDVEQTRLSVENLETEGAGPVSFALRRGELLGLVGLRGAGQEEIGRALYGALPHHGTVRLGDQLLDLTSPHAALRQGIGLMARDRTEESVAASLTVRENTYLNPAAAGRRLFDILSPRREAERAAAVGRSVNLRPNDPELALEALSGGNQQKVVVGRWLATGRQLLIAEDPTAGVDIGAKAEIYALMAHALDRGLAVIVVSTDFEEVAQICHRALVFNRGVIVRELTGAALSTEGVIAAASASEAA